MNRTRPTISIVIPAFNEEAYIEACLRSLQAQRVDVGVEIIVVDNNSTDRTASLAARLGARVVTEKTPGVCAARQTGTEQAQGEIVISTDADTVYPHDWLNKIWSVFADRPEVVAVAGGVTYVDSPRWARLYSRSLFAVVNTIYKHTGQVKYFSACNTAFRKKYWSGYNTKLTQGGDEFGLLAQLKNKGPMVFIDHNQVRTSSRRLRQGLAYNIFVTIAFYYLFDYVWGRLTGRSLLGSYSAIRQEKPKLTARHWFVKAAATLMIMVAGVSIAGHNAKATRMIHRTRLGLGHIEDRLDRSVR